MTYTIRKTNNSKLIDLDNEIIDTETLSGIGLIGFLTPNYGETQSNNFVHLTENFANLTFPKNPLVGQLCYKLTNTGEGDLYVCISLSDNEEERWKKLPLVYVGEEFPNNRTLVTGDMWYDSKEHIFKMYDELLDSWLKIGPEDYNNTIVEVIKNDATESGTSLIGTYDFNELSTKIGSYFITLEVIGKEVSNIDGGYINSSLTAAWRIQLLVNCYQSSPTNFACEIVGEPDYELIGTNDGSWNVIVSMENGVLKINGTGNIQNSSNKIKWVSKLNMLLVN